MYLSLDFYIEKCWDCKKFRGFHKQFFERRSQITFQSGQLNQEGEERKRRRDFFLLFRVVSKIKEKGGAGREERKRIMFPLVQQCVFLTAQFCIVTYLNKSLMNHALSFYFPFSYSLTIFLCPRIGKQRDGDHQFDIYVLFVLSHIKLVITNNIM